VFGRICGLFRVCFVGLPALLVLVYLDVVCGFLVLFGFCVLRDL